MASMTLSCEDARWSVGTRDIVVIVGKLVKCSCLPGGMCFTEHVKGVVVGIGCP